MESSLGHLNKTIGARRVSSLTKAAVFARTEHIMFPMCIT
jgi:hypothetical protein